MYACMYMHMYIVWLFGGKTANYMFHVGGGEVCHNFGRTGGSCLDGLRDGMPEQALHIHIRTCT